VIEMDEAHEVQTDNNESGLRRCDRGSGFGVDSQST
jgi:hypothetical protein